MAMRNSREITLAVSLALAGCGQAMPSQTAPPVQSPSAKAAIPPATQAQVQTALAYKADVVSLDDLKRSQTGPVDVSEAPPPDLLVHVLPRALTPEQAQKLLISVPSSEVMTASSDRHVEFLGPFWGAPFLGGLAPFGIGPLPFFPFDALNARFFFPFSFLARTFFFPFAFDDGLFFPSFCPFYFGASAFLPYCQPPLVYFGTGIPPLPFGGPPIPPPILPPGPLGVPPVPPPGPGIAPPIPPGPGAVPPIPPAGPGPAVAPPVPPVGPAGPYGAVPPIGPGGPYGPVPPIPPVGPFGPGPIAPLTPLPVTVAEGARPLLYFPGEVPVL